MKFTVNSNEMKTAMGLVSRAIASKNTLPILDCVMLEEKDGKLTITGGDQENMMTISVPMTDVQDFQPVCIEAALLKEMLGATDKQPVTFSIDGTSATLTHSTGHFNFVCSSVNEYPKVEENIEAIDSFTMPVATFCKAIAMCRPYADSDDLRPILNGVYLDMKGKNLTFVATDKHRMIRKEFPEVEARGKVGCVVNSKAASLLGAYQGQSEMTVRMNDHKTLFVTDNFRLLTINIEGVYPNYNAVIPMSNPIHVEVDRLGFAAALKRAMVAGDKATSLVKLSLSTFMDGEGQLSIEARDLTFSRSGQDMVPCTHNHSGVLNIGFKGTFLQELLATHTSTKVQLGLTDASRAVILRDIEGDTDLLTLLMPMQLQ